MAAMRGAAMPPFWGRVLRLVLCAGIGILLVTNANAARTRLHAVDVGSEEAASITAAEFNAVMRMDPALSGRNIGLQPLSIKRNDRYAYLIARVLGSPPTWLTYLDAILELKDGRWVGTGYESSDRQPSDSISTMCRFGAGLRSAVFRECGHSKRGKR